MQILRKKTRRRVGTVVTAIGLVSGLFTVLANKLFDLGKSASWVLIIIALISFVVAVILIVYDVIGALHAIQTQKKEQKDFVALKNEVVEIRKQYEEFQKYIKSMEQTIGSRMVCPAGDSAFKYNSTDVTAETNLLLSQYPNSEIHIICYGRNVYGEVIDYIREKQLNVAIKIIV